MGIFEGKEGSREGKGKAGLGNIPDTPQKCRNNVQAYDIPLRQLDAPVHHFIT